MKFHHCTFISPLTIGIHYHNREKSLFIRKYLMLPKHWDIIHACNVIGTQLFLKLKCKENTNIHLNCTNESQKDPQIFRLLYVWHMVSLRRPKKKNPNSKYQYFPELPTRPSETREGQENYTTAFSSWRIFKRKTFKKKTGGSTSDAQVMGQAVLRTKLKGALLSRATPHTQAWNQYTR